MFSLFFTTPVKHQPRVAGGQDAGGPSRAQVITTWGLLLIWLGLMSFGALSLLNPQWLQQAASLGIEAEAHAYKNYGDDALHQQDYGLAAAQYLRSLEIKPGQVDVSVNLAIAYSRGGNTIQALEILNQALARADADSRTGVIHYNLGELLEQQGNHNEALRHYHQTIGYDVEQDLVYRKLGALYLRMGDLEQARMAFEKTLTSQCDVQLQYKYMLRRQLELHAENPEQRRILKAELARDIGPEDLERYDLETIRQAQQRDPEIAKTHNHLGVICARLGNVDEAIDHFEKSAEIWPGNVDAVRNLPILRRRQGEQP